MNKKTLSERDMCTKFITPALVSANWDLMSQIREEVSFTKGRVVVRGQLSTRGEPKRADYLLYLKPGIPLAVVEAMRWCDQLETHLATASTAGAHLLDATLRLAFQPR